VQPEFKTKLLTAMEVFAKEQAEFVSDYTIKGPMVAGIKPSEASDRLAVYQVRFDEIWKRFVTLSAGEELFGLPKTEYVDIARIKKELGLLSKLYGLYNDVLKGISGWVRSRNAAAHARPS
jgi:dynein heavy chain